MSGELCEIRGYAFVFNPGSNEYRRHPELRTRLFSPADAGHIVTKLPPEVELSSLEYKLADRRLVVTDGKRFILDINEFGSGR